MKKVIILLLLCVSSNVNAQDKQYLAQHLYLVTKTGKQPWGKLVTLQYDSFFQKYYLGFVNVYDLTVRQTFVLKRDYVPELDLVVYTEAKNNVSTKKEIQIFINKDEYYLLEGVAEFKPKYKNGK